MKLQLISLGCSKNRVDSEHLLKQAALAGIVIVPEENDLAANSVDVVVINTCGFINDAKEESIEMILSMCELRKQKKIKRLYVMGCLSQRFLLQRHQHSFVLHLYHPKRLFLGIHLQE